MTNQTHKTGIFYGSTTGTTADVASRIARRMGVDSADVHDVAASAPHDVEPYDLLLLGTSTWGAGDLQDDWYDYLTGLRMIDLKGKKVALFGVGDESMTDTFCNAMAILRDGLRDTGAEFIGAYPDTDYDFKESASDEDGVGIGLMLDETNRPELTDKRIDAWAALLEKES